MIVFPEEFRIGGRTPIPPRHDHLPYRPCAAHRARRHRLRPRRNHSPSHRPRAVRARPDSMSRQREQTLIPIHEPILQSPCGCALYALSDRATVPVGRRVFGGTRVARTGNLPIVDGFPPGGRRRPERALGRHHRDPCCGPCREPVPAEPAGLVCDFRLLPSFATQYSPRIANRFPLQFRRFSGMLLWPQANGQPHAGPVADWLGNPSAHSLP